MPTPRIRLGTRASALARWQANWVAEQLTARGVAVELIPISTRGDVEQTGPIGNLGGTGVFTKELQRALLDERIDLAVHSLKDLPTEPVDGLCLAAVPSRERPFDVLVAREASSLSALAQGAVVGTGSSRRKAQLLHARPDLTIRDVRGNVDTRLGKLAAGDYDALVLAEAGLSRLGFRERITQVFDTDTMLPAIGQGALGLETRLGDTGTREILTALDDQASHRAVLAERTLLAALRGGCLAPIGAWARLVDGGLLRLDAVVLATDGSRGIRHAGQAPLDEAEPLGHAVAERLLADGADQLLRG